jgi:formylglycine-generating enzyme required for sulfatase activity
LLSVVVAAGCANAQHAPEKKESANPGASVSAKPQAAPKALNPYTEKIPSSLITFDMVPVTGKVAKGGADASSEAPTKSFWISKHEVTWDAFDIFLFRLDMTEAERNQVGRDAQLRPSKPYGAPDRGFGHAGYPALAMTYHSAEMYCQWLSQKTGRTYRLPSEAEWQYACLAGADQSPAQQGAEALGKVAWYWDNAQDKTHPVGKKQPNGWGIYDMLGNVAEWATGRDGNPVACGGSYDDDAKDVTPGARKLPTKEWDATDPQNPKSKWWLSDAPFIGFRVVCEE